MAHAASSLFDVSPAGGFMCALFTRKGNMSEKQKWLSIFNPGALASTSPPPASCSFLQGIARVRKVALALRFDSRNINCGLDDVHITTHKLWALNI